MKTIFSMLMFATVLVAAESCQSAGQKESATSTKSDDPKPAESSSAIPDDMKNIVGEWELVKIIADVNGNHKIDPEEDAKAITTMQDMIKLNADGTCEYTIAHLEGRYEITTKEDGRKKLVMYDQSGAETNKGRYILSLTDKELVINRIVGGSDFEVFKRR